MAFALLPMTAMGLVSAVPAQALGLSFYAYAGGTASAPSSCPQDLSNTPSLECSLADALALATGGDIVYLGTPGATAHYVGNWSLTPTGTTSAEPVTIEPAPSVTGPVLDGNNGVLNAACATALCDGPVLTITGAGYVDIDNITIEDGDNLTALRAMGGAIQNGTASNPGANLTVSGSTFTDNTAGSASTPGLGGAISNADNSTASLTVAGSTFDGNQANQTSLGKGGEGGAINSGDGGHGSLTVSGSTFTDNTASADGGAIDNGEQGLTSPGNGTLTVSSSTFEGNQGIDGGAIDNGDSSTGTSTTTVTSSLFESNYASDGGAIGNGDNVGTGQVSVASSTFVSNTAGRDGGAVDNGDGGGAGTFNVSTSTFSANTAAADGNTIANGDNAGGGTIALAANIFQGTCDHVAGTWDDLGYNVGSGTTCFNAAATDDNDGANLAGQLGSLANNGGATQTIAVLSGNPALGIVPLNTSATLNGTATTLCPTTDQRGVTPNGVACDAGAWQTGAQTISFTTSAPSPAVVAGTYTPAATGGNSGNSVVFSIDSTSTAVCSIGSGVVTFNATGTCTVDANQLGNANGYLAAPQAQQSVNVTASAGGGGGGGGAPLPTLTVTAPSPSITVGSSVPALVPTYSASGYPASAPPTPATCTTTATSASPAGTYPVTCSGAVDASYTLAYVPGTLTIEPSAPATTSTTLPAPPPAHSTTGGSRLACTPTGTGWWVLAAGGKVANFGTAASYGGHSGATAAQAPVAIAATPDGLGYWLATAGGAVYRFGDAQLYGSPAKLHLNKPIVAMAATPDGKGYWLVAADGGVFNYGDARLYRAASGTQSNKPIVAMAATPDGKGYWLVSADATVLNFGDAERFASIADKHLVAPIEGIASSPDGGGYWLVSTDGGVFNFGDAHFYGAEGGKKSAAVAGLVASATSYAIVSGSGKATDFPAA